MKNLASLLFGLLFLGGGHAFAAGQSGPPAKAGAAESGQAAGPETKGNLSMAKAVAMALRRNADLRVESLYAAMTAEGVKRSRAIYDPYATASITGGEAHVANLSGSDKNAGGSAGVTQLLPWGTSISATGQTGFLVQREPPPGSPDLDFSSSVNVYVTQPLLKNAGRKITEANIVLAKYALQGTLDQYRSYAADTVLSVVIAYNRLYALRQTQESKKASLQAAKKLLETTREKLKTHAARALDVANAEYGVALRLKDLVDAEKNMRDQEANLRYLIGMTSKEEIIPSDPPTREEPEETEEQALKAALRLRPDLKQLRSGLKSAQYQAQVSKHQTLPDLSLVLSGGLYGSGGTFYDNLQQVDRGQGYWSATLQLTRPLGNTAAESDCRRSKIQEEQARAQIAALSQRIRNDVQSDFRALISARLQIRVADMALRQATQRLSGYQANVAAGSATTQDVVNAEADLSSARSSRIDALDGYAEGLTRLWRDTGEILDRMGVKIETSKQEDLMGGDKG